MRDAHLQFAKDHEHWTLEDWKRVIWSDETSVVIGHRRGGWRLWRRPDEAFVYSCIRPRWAGYMEFMWWSCFSYDEKGPYHIWVPETPAEKKAADTEIERRNAAAEPELQAEWELNTMMARVGLRNKPGRKPKWNFTKKRGKLVREQSKGGIDWWRYQKEILIPKLIPFAKECQKKRKNTLVQEDGEPSHSHFAQAEVFSLAGVSRMIWPGNSPDLNAIEPCWPWMKRNTTKRGPPESREEAVKRWKEWWEALPQTQIQAWIERIPEHIDKIIKLKGGNEYKEGRCKKFDRRDYAVHDSSSDESDRSDWTEEEEAEEGDYSGSSLINLIF